MNRNTIKIGNTLIGDERPCYIIAEIGINHNGSVDIAKRLIDAAADSGCNAVKFQKRTVDVVYTMEELEKPRENPFGPTNGDLKRGLEFGLSQYKEIDAYCKKKGISWFASCWDEKSVDFIRQFDPPCYKIASAALTDDSLLRYHRREKKPIILSTGMSDLSIIDHAVEVLGEDDLLIMHCTSTYPSKTEELNLRGIETLRNRFRVPIGYSGHEVGLYTTFAATVLGAACVERHITLDRAMWGSDQAASVEPQGMKRLVADIRNWENARGDGQIRIYESEIPIMKKLRRVG
ncbi:MAG: N-acetylneuraminate synthase family protein [Candidatus Omnitrophota bacterium]